MANYFTSTLLKMMLVCHYEKANCENMVTVIRIGCLFYVSEALLLVGLGKVSINFK